MGRIAATSGGLGDIVFAIPVMRQLGVTDVYVKQSYYFPPYGNLHDAIKRLLEHEGFKVHPTAGGLPPMQYADNLKFDYDMDAARKQPHRGKNHIIISYLNQFKIRFDEWQEPWLTVQPAKDLPGPYNLIHLTPRWRDESEVRWNKVLQSIKGKVYFIGFQHEWLDFCKRWGNVEWLMTDDIYDMAQVIAGCEDLYCNQSVSLALAQGLGKSYHCEFKPGKTNCRIYTDNENILR